MPRTDRRHSPGFRRGRTPPRQSSTVSTVSMASTASTASTVRPRPTARPPPSSESTPCDTSDSPPGWNFPMEFGAGIPTGTPRYRGGTRTHPSGTPTGTTAPVRAAAPLSFPECTYHTHHGVSASSRRESRRGAPTGEWCDRYDLYLPHARPPRRALPPTSGPPTATERRSELDFERLWRCPRTVRPAISRHDIDTVARSLVNRHDSVPGKRRPIASPGSVNRLLDDSGDTMGGHPHKEIEIDHALRWDGRPA